MTIARLSQEFAERLPERLALLRAAVNATPGDPDALETAILLAHRLRGTAGSFGKPALGEAAGRLEDALLHRQQGAASQVGQVDPCQDRLMVEIMAAAGLPAPLSATAAPAPPSSGQPPQTRPRLIAFDSDDHLRPLVGTFAQRHRVDVVTVQSEDAAMAVAVDTGAPLTAAILSVPPDSAEAFRLAGRLRSLPGHERLPIAFVSGDHTMACRVAVAHAGGSLFLEQSLSVDLFDQAVAQLVHLAEPQQQRVLIVEDDEDFGKLVAEILGGPQVEARTLADPARLMAVLDDYRPDVLILDVVLPGVSGFDLCRALRSSPRWQALAILFVTSRIDVAGRLEAFRAGGTDFLCKPILAEELIARVQVRLEQIRLQRDRADLDALSGLSQRRAFLEQLDIRLSEARRYGRPLSLGLLDIDLFKQVNDHHGHLVGDQVIAGLGGLLRQRFRVEDMRGRWGGEEFVIAFPNQSAALMQGALQRTLAEFQQTPFHADDGIAFRCSFTAGIATFPVDGDSAQGLIREADRRLYQGKHGGRAQVVCSDEPTCAAG